MRKHTSWTLPLASVQWLFFIFANTVVVPLSVGSAFELPTHDIAGILRSSLIFTGIACMLQGFIGHRYPLLEGHSGVMWGLTLTLSASASSMGMSLTSIGGGIATGMLLAGFVVATLGALNLLGFIQKIFTPMVMNVFLFLLTFQLILIFFKGMLKTSADGVLDMPVSLFSIGIAIFVILLKIKGKPAIGNFSILIGMVVGWILYVLVFPSGQSVNVESSLSFPIFPFGKPNLNVSIIAVAFLASFVNLSNTIASVRAVSNLLQQKATESQLRRSYVLTGLFSIPASVLGLVSYATFASSIGFLESTRNFDRKPFLIGGGLMSLLGIIPFLGGILATLPITVGNAVLFAAYLQLLGTSLKGIKGYDFNSVTIHRLALPLLVGVCIMNVDATLFSGMPALLQPLLTNGFIMGVLLSILLEKLINWDKVGP
ncbi:uracil/xanthine transporter [Paenibacillus sp. PAMC21692]|uniref:uracil/xanthine transporter n=1 Tax=Paenibacillus sp. PAMC21692 TaxID=2762320 RepID=UPI00164DF347|nr:uracil/xanthine transporter [Paenibacillus sp. PAMC21692]QNK57373.1 uracil/xanthine transporter [Paenibacillus sp. PAMC21692]